MKYFKQETFYTCGCACFRMVLSHFFDVVPSESKLEKEMHTAPENTGTSYEDMNSIGDKYGLQTKQGENGKLAELDKLVEDGWVVILGISLDVPHFVVYLENNGNHIFLNDPFRGERSNFLVSKFLRNHWEVNDQKYRMLKFDYPDLVFDPEMNTKGWWLAYKLKEE